MLNHTNPFWSKLVEPIKGIVSNDIVNQLCGDYDMTQEEYAASLFFALTYCGD